MGTHAHCHPVDKCIMFYMSDIHWIKWQLILQILLKL